MFQSQLLQTLFSSIYLCFIISKQPIYGVTSGVPLRFKRAIGHRDLFYIDDKDVDFKDVRITDYLSWPFYLILCIFLSVLYVGTVGD